jgi:hypothetical protein
MILRSGDIYDLLKKWFQPLSLPTIHMISGVLSDGHHGRDLHALIHHDREFLIRLLVDYQMSFFKKFDFISHI